MLRIHFTDADLTRVRLAGCPDALWEVLLGLHAMQNGDHPLVLRSWRRRATRTIPRAQARLLFELAPPVGYSPDFLTPDGSPRGIENLCSASRRIGSGSNSPNSPPAGPPPGPGYGRSPELIMVRGRHSGS
jgi:hypothetical protein